MPDATGPAWAAYEDACARWPAYRAVVTRAGSRIPAGSWADVPVVSKADMFGDGLAAWVPAPRLTGAKEIVCSSGQSGPPHAFGVVAAEAADAVTHQVDGIVARLGGGPDSPTLIVNVLPMGVGVATRLATVSVPSVHMPMALTVLQQIAPAFDRVVLLGEPLFVGELVRRWAAAGPVHLEPWVFVGGEPVASSWRRYVAGLLGVPSWRIMTSFGIAEIGLNLLAETPELAGVRDGLAAAGAAGDWPWAAAAGPGVVPALLTYDPARLHVEAVARSADDDPTLVVTTLHHGEVPFVRYDTRDVGIVLDDGTRAALEAAAGMPLPDPVVALVGRDQSMRGADGRRLRPEAIKEALFADPGLRDACSGRFRLTRGDAGALALHVQRRDDAEVPLPTAALRAWLDAYAGEAADVVVHPATGYPYHLAGDWTTKPVYVDRPAATAT